ncbi:MAG: phospho-N-acetylmuramoyl-pentapeptide-transferase [Candidatus Caenarcaniphilales bacterium]|nr:phospho-N-acetylmuramoyl-pentapeptide-transferase [Candidatus Caenarcaniphilales bacterium]
MIITFLGAFLFSSLLVALLEDALLNILNKLGFRQIIREEGPSSHHSKQFIPTAGGIIFPISLLSGLLVCLISSLSVEINWGRTLLIFFITLMAGAIGFSDDYLMKVKKKNEGLRPKQKFLTQLLISLIVSLVLQRTSSNFFGQEIDISIFIFPILVFLVISGTMNAANLTDGLDGLASSILGWSFIGLAGLILLRENPSIESIILSLSLAGLCFGFLKINGHPAKVFMGDTGSFFLGGGLAIISLANNLEWYLLILAIVPIWETITVISQIISCKLSKKFLGKDLRPFKMTPFHHHLELSGWNEKKVVFVLSFLQFIACISLVCFEIITHPSKDHFAFLQIY